jgi:hypothetical protein
MDVILAFLKTLQHGLICIEDSFFDEVIGSMFEDSSTELLSSVEVYNDSDPNTRIPGKRAVTANIQSEDSLEKIIASFIEAYTLSLRLQRSGQDNVSINRVNLNAHINTVSQHLNSATEWYDAVAEDSTKTNDYKLAVKDSYLKCKEAVDNFNDFVTNVVNKGTSNIVFVQPDNSSIKISTLRPLPPR